MVRGWEAINGYNPLRIGEYDRLVSPGEQNWNVSERQFPPSFSNYDAPLAKALGLSYLVLGSPLQNVSGLSALPPSETLLAGPPVWIYRIPGALPRVSMVRQLEAGMTRPDPTPSGAAEQDEAKIESSMAGRLDVVTRSTADGFLLVHDLYYPGWVAEVDDRQAPIIRVDLLFRAVKIPAGAHHVTFRFAPFSLGNLKSAFGMALGQRTIAPRAALASERR